MMELRKNLRLEISLTLICLVFVLLGVFSPSFIFKINAGAELEGSGTQLDPYQITSSDDLVIMQNNIKNGENSSAYYKLMNNISLSQEGTWNPIGKIGNAFSGYFDGNGKIISDIKIIYDKSLGESSLGLFGIIENAEIKNLAVNINVELNDEKDIVLSSLKVGGISGQAINSTIYNCKINFELETNRKAYTLTQDIEIDRNAIYFTRSGDLGNYTYTYVPYENTNINDIGTYYELLKTGENKYNGEVVCGGAIGYGQGLEIYQCAITTKINIAQDGNNIVNSYFGGAVGQMNGGEIYFVYIAPSDSLISKISAKSGALPALDAGDADILISSLKTTGSTISFGGIVGYVQNSNLIAFNNIYSSLYYTSTPSKLNCGGIIGRINSNSSEHPQDLTYSKYLNISSAFVSSFSSAVGNAAAVSYIVNTSNSSFSSMPTVKFYSTGSWKYLKDWDFANVWKKSSIITYSGYFFPNLQCFATFNIKLSANYTVRYNSDETYNSGYINLYFVSPNGEILLKDDNETYVTEKDFNAGEEVKIRAVFYNDDNPLRDFKYYYNFTNWRLDDTTAVPAAYINNESNKTINTSNGYISESTETQSTITFTASSSKEGTYGIGLIGKNVKVKVYLLVENGTGNEENFGSVDQTIINNRITNHSSDFEIMISQYENKVATILEAINNADSKYVFANRGWVDYNNSENFMSTRKISFELDNNKKSTLSRFYPTVIYDEEEGLISEIICYFSNNTSELTLKVQGKGNVTIDDGSPITENSNENIINNKLTTLFATPNEGYKFIGWYMSGILLSTNRTYTTSINEARTIEARFEESELVSGGAFPGWAIAIIVVGAVLILGIIILIIIKIKKNSMGNYKKNYRY